MTERAPSCIIEDAPPSLRTMVVRSAAGWGVAVMHGAEAIAFMTPRQADEQAREIRKLAKLARNPGKCPCEIGL